MGRFYQFWFALTSFGFVVTVPGEGRIRPFMNPIKAWRFSFGELSPANGDRIDVTDPNGSMTAAEIEAILSMEGINF